MGGRKRAAGEPPLTRSEVMARVRSSDTRPERRVRAALWADGLRYRLNDKRLPGRPDVVFPSRRIVVFVHGCFWHRHPGCPSTRTPKTRVDFWEAKFVENTTRDARVEAELRDLGWRVIVVWECETRDPARLADIAADIKSTPRLTSRSRVASAAGAER